MCQQGFERKKGPEVLGCFNPLQEKKCEMVDPKLVSEAINEVLDNKNKYVHLRPDLDINYCIDQYIKIFKEVLQG